MDRDLISSLISYVGDQEENVEGNAKGRSQNEAETAKA
jgi:hypothetical protein